MMVLSSYRRLILSAGVPVQTSDTYSVCVAWPGRLRLRLSPHRPASALLALRSLLFFPLNFIPPSPFPLLPPASPVDFGLRETQNGRMANQAPFPPVLVHHAHVLLSLVLSYLNGSSTTPLLHATPLLRSSTPSLFRSDNPPHHHAPSSGLRNAPARHPATLVHLFVFARYSITARSWDDLLLRVTYRPVRTLRCFEVRGSLRRRSLKGGQSFIVSRLPLGIRCIIVVDSCIFPGLFVICRCGVGVCAVPYNVALVHRAQLKCCVMRVPKAFFFLYYLVSRDACGSMARMHMLR